MSSKITIEKYQDSFAQDWDKFVIKSSANGTFLQSRRFLSYHPVNKFKDESLVLKKGQEIIAALPGCECWEDGAKVFLSHPGSTFGGLVVSPKYLAISKLLDLIKRIDTFLYEEGYKEIELKQTSDFFSRTENSSIEYALQHEGYAECKELSFVIDLRSYKNPVESNFTSSCRRDSRYGLKAGCEFCQLTTNKEIADFYRVLEKSLRKFSSKPVHTLEELIDFKDNRLKQEVEFYGVMLQDRLVAGSMVFLFDKDVFHTQYLAADPDYLDSFPMNFMDWNLIRIAKERGFRGFSFGISTEDHGKVLNSSLATFKEGFGGCHSINRRYKKKLGDYRGK